MKKFDLWYKTGASNSSEEKVLPKEDIYIIVSDTKGDWHGEGNFCGWYSHEYLVDAEVYGYTNEDMTKIVWFDEPIIFDKIDIYSIAWNNPESLTKKEIEKLLSD